MGRKKIVCTIYMRPDQDAAFKAIHKQNRVPVSVLVREALDDFIAGNATAYGLLLHDESTGQYVDEQQMEQVEPDNRRWDTEDDARVHDVEAEATTTAVHRRTPKD